MKPRVIVFPSPCYSSMLVSCSLSLTLELWQGFRLSWQEGVLDKTDLFHLIWKMSPLPYDHFSDSLSCQWGSGHYARSLSRGTNGLFCCCCSALFGGYCHRHLLHGNVKSLDPDTFKSIIPCVLLWGRKALCQPKASERGEDQIY